MVPKSNFLKVIALACLLPQSQELFCAAAGGNDEDARLSDFMDRNLKELNDVASAIAQEEIRPQDILYERLDQLMLVRESFLRDKVHPQFDKLYALFQCYRFAYNINGDDYDKVISTGKGSEKFMNDFEIFINQSSKLSDYKNRPFLKEYIATMRKLFAELKTMSDELDRYQAQLASDFKKAFGFSGQSQVGVRAPAAAVASSKEQGLMAPKMAKERLDSLRNKGLITDGQAKALAAGEHPFGQAVHFQERAGKDTARRSEEQLGAPIPQRILQDYVSGFLSRGSITPEQAKKVLAGTLRIEEALEMQQKAKKASSMQVSKSSPERITTALRLARNVKKVQGAKQAAKRQDQDEDDYRMGGLF